MWARSLVIAAVFAANHAPAFAQNATGLYAGLFIGEGLTDNTVVDHSGFSYTGFPGHEVDYRDNGTTYGFAVGYNQRRGRWYLGLELDATASRLEANSLQIDPVGLDEEISTRAKLLSTLQLQIGRQTGAWLGYASAGYAAGWFENELYDLDTGNVYDPDDSYFEDGSDDGWVVGVGAAYTIQDRWQLRADARYVDLGSRAHYVNRTNLVSRGALLGIRKYDSENRFSQLRIGALYLF